MIKQHGIALFLMILGGFFLFYRLGDRPILVSDESLYANNALEILESGDWITMQFDGEPDHYNCKPPLVPVMIAGSFYLFGTNEFALRLPSALAALATFLLLWWFAVRCLKNPSIGWVAIVVLATTPGYLHDHVARTGDTDAFLVLFVTGYLLAFYRYLQATTQQRRWLWLAALCMILAFMTKGIAGLVPLPVLLIWTIVQGKFKPLMRSLNFWVSMVLVFGCCGGYLWLREVNDPGYLQAWNEVELFGRFSNDGYGGHQHPWYFYLKRLVFDRFFPWIFLLGIAVGVWYRAQHSKSSHVGYLLLVSAFVLVIYSFSASKLEWYDAPIYPLLAIVIGSGASLLWKQEQKLWKWALAGGILTAMSMGGYKIYRHIEHPPSYPIDRMVKLMHEFKETHPEEQYFNALLRVDDERLHRAPVFYGKLWKSDGYVVKPVSLDNELSGSVVLVAYAPKLKALQGLYHTEVLLQTEQGTALRVGAKR